MTEFTPRWEGTIRGYRTNGRDPWQVSIEMPEGPGIFEGTGPSVNFERGQKVHVLTAEGLAEVERAAAEKAWDEARAALRYEDDTPVELVSMVNPYRREES